MFNRTSRRFAPSLDTLENIVSLTGLTPPPPANIVGAAGGAAAGGAQTLPPTNPFEVPNPTPGLDERPGWPAGDDPGFQFSKPQWMVI